MLKKLVTVVKVEYVWVDLRNRGVPRHPFHVVASRPWPLCVGFYILGFIGGLASWLHGHAIDLVCFRTLGVVLTMMHWWRDIVVERTYQGMHTKAVQSNYYWGMALIILSEVFFFFRFFWAFLHNALAPAVEVGCQ